MSTSFPSASARQGESAPEPEPGKRIFYSSELSRVALERTKTAREAYNSWRLIETYGYYGTGKTCWWQTTRRLGHGDGGV